VFHAYLSSVLSFPRGLLRHPLKIREFSRSPILVPSCNVDYPEGVRPRPSSGPYFLDGWERELDTFPGICLSCSCVSFILAFVQQAVVPSLSPRPFHDENASGELHSLLCKYPVPGKSSPCSFPSSANTPSTYQAYRHTQCVTSLTYSLPLWSASSSAQSVVHCSREDFFSTSISSSTLRVSAWSCLSSQSHSCRQYPVCISPMSHSSTSLVDRPNMIHQLFGYVTALDLYRICCAVIR